MIRSPNRESERTQVYIRADVESDRASSVVPGSGHSPPSLPRDPAGSGLSFRRLKVQDLRYLVSDVRQESLDQPDGLLVTGGPLTAGLRALRPLSRNRPATSLAFIGDRFAGYAQFDERGPDRRWVATSVGAVGGLADDRAVLDGLLEFSVVRAGMRSVKRLFARVGSGSVVYESFLACGFEPYMDESIHVLERIRPKSTALAQVREQEPADTWAVHQLYHAAAPKHLQYAEAWTSHRWDVAARKGAQRIWRAYVMEDGYQMIAYAAVRCANDTAVLEAMYLPDRREALTPFVQSVLARVAEAAGSARIYVTARGYQQELRSALAGEDFRHVADQHLMIKYTTAKVAVRSVATPVGLPAEVLERVPKRVPTYLNRPVREERPA